MEVAALQLVAKLALLLQGVNRRSAMALAFKGGRAARDRGYAIEPVRYKWCAGP